MGDLILLIGAPGSGKSTFINTAEKEGMLPNSIVISRDKIRYSLLQPGDNYFAKEKETWKLFINSIRNGLKNGYNVYVDATHLTASARQKVLREIPRTMYNNLIGYYFDISLDTCLYRNDLRTGRERVPEDKVIQMHRAMQYPTAKEGFSQVYRLTEKEE